MAPYQRLGVVVLACMITTTALDSLHVHGLPLLSSQFFQLMAGQTDEGLCSLSHKLSLNYAYPLKAKKRRNKLSCTIEAAEHP